MERTLMHGIGGVSPISRAMWLTTRKGGKETTNSHQPVTLVMGRDTLMKAGFLGVLVLLVITLGLAEANDTQSMNDTDPLEFGFFLGDVGIGTGYDSSATKDGLAYSVELLSFSIGFRPLKGLGVKTAFLEDIGPFSSGNLLPLYIYYPLYARSKRLNEVSSVFTSLFGHNVKSPFISVFAGGTGYYAHVGVNAILYTFADEYELQPRPGAYTFTPYDRRQACMDVFTAALMKVIPVMAFSVQTGVFTHLGEDNAGNLLGGGGTGIYLVMKAGLGAYMN